MNDTQLCQCGCGKRAIRGRHYAWGHKKSDRRVTFCACGCGQKVTPGCRWRRGHWAIVHKGNIRIAQIHAAQAKVSLGGLESMAMHSAHWDDEWAVAGARHLRDTAEVLDILGRYGRVEVSYMAHNDVADPLLMLDEIVEATVESKRAERLRETFEQAGFAGLRIEEVKYLYVNGYESVEDLAS